MRLCFVVQRYGLEVGGGAELHCRWLAERLAERHSVRVETTSALDYIEWRNHYPPGGASVNGIPVRRHRVERPRDEREFALLSDLVFLEEHEPEDERRWVEANGPYCPGLVRELPRLADVDLFLFYCYRYYPTFFGLPRVAERAVLVPTAEEDPAVRLPVFRPLLGSPRGVLYLTPEERTLIAETSGNGALPSEVIGSGVNVPAGWEELDVRARFELPEHYLLYAGRIDRNKGADRLFRYYLWLAGEWPELPPLVLVGHAVLDVPKHPRIRHLGFVAEDEKYSLLGGCDVLLMPSPYESLSVILLEAWALGRAALVNGGCRVLEGQSIRSGGGLYYADYAEFAAALRLLVERPELRARLGAQGRRYVEREYAWDVVESRTERFLEGLLDDRAAP